MKSSSSTVFTIISVVVVVALLVAACFLSYFYWGNMFGKSTSTSTFKISTSNSNETATSDKPGLSNTSNSSTPILVKKIKEPVISRQKVAATKNESVKAGSGIESAAKSS
jgi:hypothetical protein